MCGLKKKVPNGRIVAIAAKDYRLGGNELDRRTATSAVRRLAFSRAVTFAGGSAAFWALSALLYEQTHSAAIVAAAALASFSVPASLSPLAGLVGDRHDRRRVMVASELAGAACFLGLALASSSTVSLLAIRVLASVAYAPLIPATNASLPAVVGPDNLDRANVAISKGGIAGALIGPAIAGVMLATVGAPLVFLLNTLTFLTSAAVISSIRGDFKPCICRREEMAAGFAFLRRHRLLRPLTIAYGIAFIGVGVSIPAEVVLAADFDAGSVGYSGLVCLWGIGSLVGASLAKLFGSQPRAVLLLALAASGMAAGFMAVSLAPIFSVALLGMALGGAGEGFWGVTQTTLVQRATPDGICSRVFASSEADRHRHRALDVRLGNRSRRHQRSIRRGRSGSGSSDVHLVLKRSPEEVALHNNPPPKVRVRKPRGAQPSASGTCLSVELAPTA
jgi:MFS family permease